MDFPNPPFPPLAHPLGPSAAEAVAARRRLNRWRMGCMILFTLVLAMGLSSGMLAFASGVVYDAREWGAALGITVLSLPVIFGWLRWNRALGRTLIAFGVWFYLVTAWMLVNRKSGAAAAIDPFLEVRALIGAGFATIFLLGGLRVRTAARIIREADPSFAPVRPRPIRDLLVVAICAAVGGGLAFRARDQVRDLADLRTRRDCAENLRAVAAAIRDYQAVHNVRPPTLDLLVGTTSLTAESLACTVRGPNGQPVPFMYHPDAGVFERDIVACDAADSHGPRGINILTGSGTVVRGTRENVEQYLAATRASRLSDRMAESIDRGEEPPLDDRMAYFNEMEGVARTLSPQQQADMKVLAGVLRELAQQQETVTAAYYAAIGKFGDAGGIGPAELTSREAIRERLELLAEGRRKQAPVLALVKSTVDDLKSRLGPDLIQRDPARAAIRGAEANMELTIGINTDEAELIDLFESILKLFDEAWGQWRHDEEQDKIIFDSDEHLERYQSLLAKLDELTEHQNELRTKLTQRMRDSSRQLRSGK
ncbi:MAG: hypothetical protein AMXMBFR47_44800 [Planctomycetota bacterium]